MKCSDTWIELEEIILSDVTQTQKTSTTFSLIVDVGFGALDKCVSFGGRGIKERPYGWHFLMQTLPRTLKISQPGMLIYFSSFQNSAFWFCLFVCFLLLLFCQFDTS